MSKVNLQTEWRLSIEKRMSPVDGIPPVHATYPAKIPALLEQSVIPGVSVCRPFDFAVDIACGQPGHSYIRDFLGWTIEAAELALADERQWNGRWAESLHDQRSLIYGVLALAKAMRDDTSPDLELLRASRDDSMAHLDANSSGPSWDNITQSHHLRAIQFCLIEGDAQTARHMLDCGRSFGLTRKWHDWLKSFLYDINNAGNVPLKSKAGAAHFDSFFDAVRQPQFRPGKGMGEAMNGSLPLHRLQLALLRRVWIEGLSIAGGWQDVLASISA